MSIQAENINSVEFGKIAQLVSIQSHVKPFVGSWYSPFENGDCFVLCLVKEDDTYYYFHDGTKHLKDIPFSWFEVERPKNETLPTKYPYESYSLWSRQLAKSYSVKELQKELDKCDVLSDKYARQHLAAIKATTSMQSQSQRRAQTGNNVRGNYERKQAYKNAIELHSTYPEHSYGQCCV